MDIRNIIKNYIINEVLKGEQQDSKFLDDENLELSNIVDSLSLVRLLVFIEETFEISLDTELDLDNFASINNIVNMVQRRIDRKAV
jgi:acyl carrier protein